jgi:cell division protein FtsN
MNVTARGDVLGPGGQITTSKAEVMQKYYEQPKGKVDDTPARAKPTPPRKTPPTPVQKMTPVESKPTAKPVEAFKPKTPTEKKGIDAALDGLE